MSSPADDLEEWDRHLARELENKGRGYTFDMDEGPEQTRLARFQSLEEAIRFFDEAVKPPYKEADDRAVSHQKKHKMLAKVAIVGGGFAICFAILQLAIKQSVPAWTVMVGWLEGFAVVIGLVAAAVGLKAKFDYQWFIQRHIAERLRMVKFQALGQTEFWGGQTGEWQDRVRGMVAEIKAISDIKTVKAWATEGSAAPVEPPPPNCPADRIATAAIAIYYRRKRVDFQAAYFKKQSEKLVKGNAVLHHAALPLFLASIGAVALHFAADYIAAQTHEHPARQAWELTGVWALAFAALFPVLGFIARQWLGAFEGPRSAHLFQAKHRALGKSSENLGLHRADCVKTMHEIAHVEHFLEHEHREWLRLLLAAEWLL